MLAILSAGIFAYYRLPISNLPNVTYPTIAVSVSFPGMTPEMMAHAVALPLEKQFMAVPGVKLVSSNNTLGSSSIVLQFDINKDITEAAQDVQSAIIAATPTLPPQLPYAPTYRKTNPAELPIVYVSLTSETMPLTDLYTYANNLIGQRISMLNGVSQVNVFGSPLAIRIQVDPARLIALDLSLDDLAAAISLGNANLPTGQLDGPIEAPNISVDGQLITAESWDALIVAYRNGTPIRIKDVGKTVESFQNDKINVQYLKEGTVQPAIILAIQKQSNANAVAISDAIHELLEGLKTELPKSVDVTIFFDYSISIREAINDMKNTLWIAFALVIIVIALYLGTLVDTIIPSIVIPITIIGTFMIMDWLNFSLDSLSLLALTLAVGFIIDDAIVVLENIVRHQEMGKNRLEAAMEGSQQICFTIISMTLSLIAVFIPMLFMGGLLGRIFKEFAVTLSVVTVISGIIALTLTPMLCSRFLPKSDIPKERKSRIFQWSHNLNEKMRGAYERMLRKVIDYTYIALGIGVLCLVLTGVLFFSLPVDFLPDEDTGFFIAYVQGMEAGSSERMLEYQNRILDIIKANPSVASAVGISSYSEYRKGQNLISLKPLNQRPPIRKVLQELDEQLSQIPGIQIFLKNVPLIDLSTGQESRGDYQFAMQSIYPDKVYPSAKRMIAKMQSDPLFQGVNTDLEIDSPQINVHILRDRASSLGLTATDIENAFNYSYSYNYITRIDTPIDQYNVILELHKKDQRSDNTFNLLWMRSSISSDLVPMTAVATWKEELGASSVNHIDQFPSATVSFNLSPHVSLSQALEKLDEFKEELVDPSVIVQTIGAAQAFEESTQSAVPLIFIAIFSIYIILGMLYESFIHPITVLTTLPPATLGGLLTLWIFGMPLSMYSFLGIILLIGIVKKNGIMMVDFALENIRTKGMAPKEAIINASLVRFRPIMMTTVAAIAGALPIAVGLGAGAAARQPLGLVIIGGLLLSQLITLFMTPILYLVFEKVNSRIPWR
jgi:hydrophobic/amphiphilic exporter-1 (mainly G- bacteria), HAE1 family